MRFLIDANLPRSIIALVTSLGHESEFARDIGLAAALDSEIAARAKTTGAALLTLATLTSGIVFSQCAPTERSPLSDQNSLRNEIPTVRPYGSRNAG